MIPIGGDRVGSQPVEQRVGRIGQPGGAAPTSRFRRVPQLRRLTQRTTPTITAAPSPCEGPLCAPTSRSRSAAIACGGKKDDSAQPPRPSVAAADASLRQSRRRDHAQRVKACRVVHLPLLCAGAPPPAPASARSSLAPFDSLRFASSQTHCERSKSAIGDVALSAIVRAFACAGQNLRYPTSRGESRQYP